MSSNSPPLMSPPAQEAGKGKSRTLPARSRKQSSKTNIGFTFVDQSEDLKSLADKRIVSSSQRHAIRSHVMKSVRHSENLIGKKRPTGRETNRRSSTKTLRTLPFIECELTSLTSSSISSNDSDRSKSDSPPSDQQLIRIPPDPSPRFDPFYSLPGNEGPSYHLIESLVKYCFDIFLPMTFPVERSDNDVSKRRGLILNSKIGNPASFFGMMAIVAAHRAITSGRHHDLKPSNFDHGLLLFDDEYAIMKDYAIRATRAKTAERSGFNADSMEATFSLIGAATIIGNFEEARIYLSGVRMNLAPNNEAFDPSLPATAFIPMSDAKAAVGMLSKPLFPISWVTDATEEANLISKITPKSSSSMKHMGRSFLSLNRYHGLDWDLSIKIQEILRVAIAVCWFSQVNADSPRSLNVRDHELFRIKTFELENGMLAYVFDGDNVEPTPPPPVEHIIRLTALAMVSAFISQALPSAGLGRALTFHQMNAYDAFLQCLGPGQAPALSERRVVVWAMFSYITGADGQPEEQYFLGVLAEQLRALQISSWDEVEMLLYTFLYVPAFQRKKLRQIWERAETVRRREDSVSSWSTLSPPTIHTITPTFEGG